MSGIQARTSPYQFPVAFTINYSLFREDCNYVGNMRLPLKSHIFETFVNRLLHVKDWCTDEGQKRSVQKFVNTVTDIQRENVAGARDAVLRNLYNAFDAQLLKVENIILNNTIVAQHYGYVKRLTSKCTFIKDGVYFICVSHRPMDLVTKIYPEVLTRCLTKFDEEIPVRGLVVRNAAGNIGNFATFQEYSEYAALIANARLEEASNKAAALAAGAHPHSLRDPFPFGYCKLLLFKQESWSKIFKFGQDTLTRGELVKYAGDLDENKIICFTIDNVNNQAHLSAHREAPAGTSVLVDVKQLVALLTVAFADGVCDYEELSVIYHCIKPARRNGD